MFKHYEERYEKFFEKDYTKNTSLKMNIEDVSVYKNDPLNTTMYIKEFKDEIRKFDRDILDHLVKIYWLARRFTYKGKRRVHRKGNGRILDSVYATFMRNTLGYDLKFISVNRGSINKIVTYLDDLFPNFDEGNPFKEKYEFPYKNITLCHMVVVYQMSDRLEILKYADEQNMTYGRFMDYIINYVNCHNEELGKNEYEFIFSDKFMHYVKKMF